MLQVEQRYDVAQTSDPVDGIKSKVTNRAKQRRRLAAAAAD